MGILFSSLYSSVILAYGLYVSLNLDDAVIKDRLISIVQNISHFKYFSRQNPMISKIQYLT